MNNVNTTTQIQAESPGGRPLTAVRRPWAVHSLSEGLQLSSLHVCFSISNIRCNRRILCKTIHSSYSSVHLGWGDWSIDACLKWNSSTQFTYFTTITYVHYCCNNTDGFTCAQCLLLSKNVFVKETEWKLSVLPYFMPVTHTMPTHYPKQTNKQKQTTQTSKNLNLL